MNVDASPTVLRVLWAVTAVFLVAGLLAAAVEAGGESDSADVQAGATTTTVVALPTGEPVPVDPGATTPPAPTETTAAPGGPGTATTARPSATSAPAPTTTAGISQGSPMPATVVPKAGTYRYRSTSQDEGEEAKEDVTVKVEDLGAAGDARNLKVTTASSDGHLVEEKRWGPTELRVSKMTGSSGVFSFDCDWTPDYLELRTDLRNGLNWTSDSSCPVSAGGQQVVLRRQFESKVTGSEVTTVGGRQVQVWIIESKGSFTANGQGATIDSVLKFAPANGVVVFFSQRSEQESFDRELVSLDPS